MAVILITGASRGIGRATAQLLAEQGHTVYGTSRDPDNVVIHNVRMLRLDVTSNGSALAAVQSVVGKSGRLDVLINNAGISMFGALEEISVEQAQALFDTNFFGVLRMVNYALPVMRQQGEGKIINISSIAGLTGVPYLGIYAASKHALEGYTESMRYEVKQFGVQVTLIEPGDVNTSIGADAAVEKQIDAYAETRARVYTKHTESMQNAPAPEVVSRTGSKVVRAKSPKMRYTVGAESFLPVAQRIFPASLIERFLRNYFKLP